MDTVGNNAAFIPFPVDSVWENRETHVRYKVVGCSPLTLQLRVERTEDPYWYPTTTPFLFNPADLQRDFKRVR